LGADGANSFVRRRLGRAFERRQLSIATGFYAHDISSEEIVVRFVPNPQGYIWSFPRVDHLAIGICAQADEAQPGPLRERVAQWIAQSGIAKGARLEPYSWPIPSLAAADFAHDRPAGDRWMLLGDAAGLVDPITREGIFFALRSAEMAVEALMGPDASRGYHTRLAGEIHPELQHAARLKSQFFRGPFTRLLIDALTRSDAVRAIMRDLVAGQQPYGRLKRRLIGTFEVKLAWQLLRLELARM
jgi:flavin-dependent dehydrogenase